MWEGACPRWRCQSRNPLTDPELSGTSPLPHLCAVWRLERHIPKNCRAVHHSPLWPVVIDRVMLGHAVVPEGHVVLLPAPADGELWPCRMSKQQLENGFAFSRLQLIDPGGKPIADKQRLAPTHRVRAHYRVRQRRVFLAGFFPARQVFGGVAKALQREGLGEVMSRR